MTQATLFLRNRSKQEAFTNTDRKWANSDMRSQKQSTAKVCWKRTVHVKMLDGKHENNGPATS